MKVGLSGGLNAQGIVKQRDHIIMDGPGSSSGSAGISGRQEPAHWEEAMNMKYRQFVHSIIRWMHEMSPSTNFFSHLRYLHYKKHLGKCAGEFKSFTGLIIDFPENVYLDRGIAFNRHVMIDPGVKGIIRIGNNCIFGPFVLLRAEDHNTKNLYEPIKLQGHLPGSIVIESNCWICGHVTITKDVTIGTGSIVGANSVVTHDIPPYSIAAGNPAHVIRKREQ